MSLFPPQVGHGRATSSEAFVIAEEEPIKVVVVRDDVVVADKTTWGLPQDLEKTNRVLSILYSYLVELKKD